MINTTKIAKTLTKSEMMTETTKKSKFLKKKLQKKENYIIIVY